MDKAHKLTDIKLAEIEKHLKGIYESAASDLVKKADRHFQRFRILDEQKQKLLKQGKITKKELEKWRKGQMMRGQHWAAMIQQTTQELANVNKTALAYINGQLPEVYALNYNAANKGIADAVRGYSFELVDAETVKFLATTDKSLLPYKELDLQKDIQWNTRQINSQVLQGIVQGESIPDIARRFQTVSLMDRAVAIRNARTMVTGAENRGRIEGYRRAEESGIVLKKEWLATHDSRTRHWHLDLDGAMAEVDEPFYNDYGSIMFPGDPAAHPANVYNCRCTLVAKVTGFKKGKK